jgi:hypothetical protein
MKPLQAVVSNRQVLLPSIFLLTIFYALAASFALRSGIVDDPDLWWHLRAGQWITEHHALPVTDPFSQAGAGKPWIAYSWLFEVVLYQLFAHFGLVGVVALTVIMTLGISVALVCHLRPMLLNEKQAVLYAEMGIIALIPLYQPRPWLFTILFFFVEYSLLLKARRDGRDKVLWGLPFLFALWANIHLQFFYGLFLLAFDSVEPLLVKLWRRETTWRDLPFEFPVSRLWLGLVCGLATLLTPYHYRLYGVVGEIAQQSDVYQFVVELKPLSFNSLTSWVGLILLIWALWRLAARGFAQPGLLILLLFGVWLSFRMTRDIWFLIIVATTALGVTAIGKPDQPATAPRWAAHVIAVLLALPLLYLRSQQAGLSNDALQAVVDKNYPVAAAQVIETRGYQGPLFNHFNWGGFLIWRLPHLPVSMDGRTNIYGGKKIGLHAALWNGAPQWKSDQELAAAGVVLTSPQQPLCELLRLDQRFECVYEDKVAVVFLPRHGTQHQAETSRQLDEVSQLPTSR